MCARVHALQCSLGHFHIKKHIRAYREIAMFAQKNDLSLFLFYVQAVKTAKLNITEQWFYSDHLDDTGGSLLSGLPTNQNTKPLLFSASSLISSLHFAQG